MCLEAMSFVQSLTVLVDGERDDRQTGWQQGNTFSALATTAVLRREECSGAKAPHKHCNPTRSAMTRVSVATNTYKFVLC